MYAIVEIGGMQWKVAKKDTLRVPMIELDPGKSLEFDRVLLVVDDENVEIGKPVVPHAKIKATVVSHGKDKKIKVFKKKRRKNYKVIRGHRQDFTEITIDQITISKAATEAKTADDKPKTQSDKPKIEKSAATKPAVKKTETKQTATPKPTTAAKKSAAPKKEKKD